MSAGYAIFNINVTNPENYKHYINALVSEGRKSETYNLAIKRNQLLGIKAARW